MTNVQGMEHLENTDQKIQWTPIFEVKEKINMFAEKYLSHSEYLVNLCEKTTIDKKHYETLRRYAHKFDGLSLLIGICQSSQKSIPC